MVPKPTKLKNLKKYKAVQNTLHIVEEPTLVLDVPKMEANETVRALLTYEGVEELQIPGSFLDIITEITALSVPQIIDVLAISKSTFYRIKDEKLLERDTVDKLASLLKIYNRGIKAFEDKDDFHFWLRSKVISLGNKMPIDLIKTENGRSAVLDAIGRIEYGIYG